MTGLANVKTYSGSSLTTLAGETEKPPARPVTTTVAALESNDATLAPGETLPAMSDIDPDKVSLMLPLVRAVVVKVNLVELCCVIVIAPTLAVPMLVKSAASTFITGSSKIATIEITPSLSVVAGVV